MKKIVSAIFMLIIVLSIIIPLDSNVSGEINIKIPDIGQINKNIFKNRNIRDTFNNNINSNWPLIFDKDDEDVSNKVIVDSEGNIIVTGYTYNTNSNEGDFLTIKYNNDGEEIWNVTYNGGKIDYTWDLALDSEDNILVFGLNFSSITSEENFNFVFHLIKYNKDGIKQWNKSYLWENVNDSFPGGIATDSNDNIILTGGYGNLDYAYFNCWTSKMDSDGIEIWNKTFNEALISLGSDVVVNSNDEIFVGGFSASFFDQGWYIIKYDSNGNQKWTQTYDNGNQMYDMELDSEENIILTGYGYSEETESSSWLTMKCNNKGDFLWEQEYDTLDGEYSQDAAVDSKDNIVTVGPNFGQDFYEPCMIIYDKNGNEICMKKPSFDGIFHGVTIDDSDKIIATGLINNSIDEYNINFYTCRYFDNTPPMATIEKPKLGFIYIFNKEFIPLKQNTIIFGKITVRITTENLSDVNKILLYLDNNLIKTIDTKPYEWTWDNRTFGNHDLEIHVYDENENINRLLINAWKFF
jgi:uncharacterized delta-60 repeat protein